MTRREDRKPKENKPLPLNSKQLKKKSLEEIRLAFRKAFAHEDSAVIPNERKR